MSQLLVTRGKTKRSIQSCSRDVYVDHSDLCQSRGEEEEHGPSLLVGIIVHCTFQQEAYSKNIHWNLMDIFIYIYWLVVWNMFFIFPYLGIIIPTDQYFSGGLKPPTSISMSFIPHLPGERLDSSDTLSLSLMPDRMLDRIQIECQLNYLKDFAKCRIEFQVEICRNFNNCKTKWLNAR